MGADIDVGNRGIGERMRGPYVLIHHVLIKIRRFLFPNDIIYDIVFHFMLLGIFITIALLIMRSIG